MNATTDSITEPCDQVTVTLARDQVAALLDLLVCASHGSYGLMITPAVRDAWITLSAAWAKANADTEAAQ